MKEKQALKALKAKMEGMNVLVIGDVMIDRYVTGKVTRISPEAPVPVLNFISSEDRMGGAANVAMNLKALGAKVILASVIGEDKDGELLMQALTDQAINTYPLFMHESRRTTVKTRFVSQQQLLRLDVETTKPLMVRVATEFWSHLKTVIQNGELSLIVLQDYNKGVLTAPLLDRIMKEAQRLGIPVAVDPKHDNFFEYVGATLFKPNLKECSEALKMNLQPEIEDLTKAAVYIRKKINHRYTLITLSEKGVFLEDGKAQIVLPTQARSVADVSGAGDTVIAVAALAMAAGADMATFGRMGNVAAGLVVAEMGVVPISATAFWKEILG